MDLKFEVTKDSILKDYIKECGVSRTLGRKIKLYGKFFINGVEAKNHFPVKIGDLIEIVLPKKINENIIKVNKNLDILYEDEWILIVNKENDLSIQPSSKHQDDNLVSRVLAYLSNKNEQSYCHVLTRLDFATSGIVVIAKNAYVHNLLANTKMTKKYLAKVSGKLSDNVGKICLPIARDITSNIKRKVDSTGKEAITLYKLIESSEDSSTYELTLVTGRTHQIRVHLAYYGLPIIGDKLYEGKNSTILHLHCYLVEFNHPINNIDLKIINYPKW